MAYNKTAFKNKKSVWFQHDMNKVHVNKHSTDFNCSLPMFYGFPLKNKLGNTNLAYKASSETDL